MKVGEITSMMKVKYYRCPQCKAKYTSLQVWGNHVKKQHPGLIPEGWSYARYFYFVKTGKRSGTCIICGKDTDWNESTQKYERFCKNPKCKENYREQFKNRMIKKYGKVFLLDDADRQREMLKKRRISGYYTFSNGMKHSYVGQYEKDFLVFLDKFLHFDPNDLMMPSPHTYEYEYKNPDDKEHEGIHHYIPDAYIPSINLEIEIKNSTNKHPGMIKKDMVKNMIKDETMKSIKGVNYIRILDKNYSEFIDLLATIGVEKTVETAEKENRLAQESMMAFPKYDEFYTRKERRKLSEFKITKLDITVINGYKDRYPTLRHIRLGNDYKGEVVVDTEKDAIVGYYQTRVIDGLVWLIAFEIMKDYRGFDLSPQLLKRAINKTGLTNLSVNSENTVAIKLYQSFGFKIYKFTDKMLFMSNKPM